MPKPFLTLLCYDAVIWAALLILIGLTVGGDPAWLAAIGIGGVGFTSWAGWFAARPHSAPTIPPETGSDGLPVPIAEPAAQAESGAHADSYGALEAVPLAVLVVSNQRDILWANDRTRLLLGEPAAGRSLMGVLRHPPLIDALDQVMAGNPSAIEGIET
ncbi:MAG: PAS domain-containing protein, partial [Dongiaceae bacterium]